VTGSTLEKLRRTLTAQGIGFDASVSETLDPKAARLRMLSERAPLREIIPGEIDPDYEIRGELGRGGMAIVYLAEQLPLARDVAIKCSGDPSDVESSFLLLREAMITGQLEHPNIVPVHALIDDGQGPAVVMKRLSGATWDELIHSGESSLERDLEIFAQVLNAVDFAHSRGVLHRDIKPANVMTGEYGEVYLLDWGVAQKANDPPNDSIVGTPRYMAPEMAEGRCDARTDVFLLGATLHEVLTGEPRHAGESALEVLYAAMHVEPYAYGESVPEELSLICNRACARDPEARFASVSALREALATFREHRAASVLSDAAEEQLAQLRDALASPSSSYVEIEQLFSRTRLGFEAALRVWADSPPAGAGLRTCLCLMIDHELASRRPETARALLLALRELDPARQARLDALESELQREQERVLAMERDHDPRVGAPDRTRAYRALAIAILAMSLALFTQRLLFPGFRPSTMRLTWIGALVLAILGAIVAWWRRHGEWNFINRRIAEVALSTLAVSFASRLSGYITGAPAEQVLVSDAFILGLGGAVLSSYHRAGPWLAALSFFVALVGSVWTAAIDELFIALSVFMPIVFLALGRVERVDGQRP
jgi:eukaryotic-like serine/threonine-protein kinase